MPKQMVDSPVRRVWVSVHVMSFMTHDIQRFSLQHCGVMGYVRVLFGAVRAMGLCAWASVQRFSAAELNCQVHGLDYGCPDSSLFCLLDRLRRLPFSWSVTVRDQPYMACSSG